MDKIDKILIFCNTKYESIKWDKLPGNAFMY